MAYKEGECFKCGKKDIVGSVCDECAKEQAEDEAYEEEWAEEHEHDFDDEPDEEEDVVGEAERQENFEN